MLRNTFRSLTNLGGYPYFYRARQVSYPYLYRNPIIGNILAGNFRLYRGFGQASLDLKHLEFLKATTSSLNKDKPFQRFNAPKTESPEKPDITNLSGKIKIWIYDEYSTRAAGGGPYLSFDFVPEELKFDVPSNLKSVGIVGLNYPHYHYMGSEETLTMTIDWYDFPANRESVVVRCRKLEALAKANGDTSGPLPIYIDWGTAYHWRSNESQLLTGHVYTIQSANYKLSQFSQRRQIYRDPEFRVNRPLIVNNGLYPLQASQELVLKREASQLTSNQIIYGTV